MHEDVIAREKEDGEEETKEWAIIS